MEKQNTTQNKSTTVIGFSGIAFLVTTLLTNTTNLDLSTINWDSVGLIGLFFITALFLLMNILLEYAITLYAPFPEHKTEGIQDLSHTFFLLGLLSTTATIITIKINILTAIIFLVMALGLLIGIIYRYKTKPQPNQPPAATEERLTQSNMEESTVRIKCEPPHITKETEDHATVLLTIRGKDIILESHLKG